jgi:hypothetical protein
MHRNDAPSHQLPQLSTTLAQLPSTRNAPRQPGGGLAAAAQWPSLGCRPPSNQHLPQSGSPAAVPPHRHHWHSQGGAACHSLQEPRVGLPRLQNVADCDPIAASRQLLNNDLIPTPPTCCSALTHTPPCCHCAALLVSVALTHRSCLLLTANTVLLPPAG